jgi:hypothetical protein
MITQTKARLIAKDNNSGPTSPLYNFYRNNRLDRQGMMLEIDDIINYANPTNRKRLKTLKEYIYMVR